MASPDLSTLGASAFAFDFIRHRDAQVAVAAHSCRSLCADVLQYLARDALPAPRAVFADCEPQLFILSREPRTFTDLGAPNATHPS